MTQIQTHRVDDHDNAYSGLLVNDAHWAFGTNFEDPLAGVDTTVPGGVDAAMLGVYCLMLGDDALVMSHRLSEWCSRAPDLEVDIAIANIALDLLGQARLLLARAAAADPALVPPLPDSSPVPDEDALAFFRDDYGFRNVRLVELRSRDFAELVVTLLLFSCWRLVVFEHLRSSRDAVLAAVAAKGIKELAYHRDFAARWLVMLAQGTDESRTRVEAALGSVLPLWPELFETHRVEAELGAAGVAVDPASFATIAETILEQLCAAAELERPRLQPQAGVLGKKGRDGMHSEAFSALLAEMQVVARAHPEGRW